MRCPCLLLSVIVAVAACGDNAGDEPADAPPSACDVVIREIPAEPGAHRPPGAPILWSSNPPATGTHYSVWARWGTYTATVPRGYWMHNLEHGGVALLYRCPDGCADDVAGLEAVVAGLPRDAKCQDPLRTRTVITPDPDLPDGVRIAASAWNWTYTATCLDPPSLRAFIDEHYGDAPEDTCAEGTFAP